MTVWIEKATYKKVRKTPFRKPYVRNLSKTTKSLLNVFQKSTQENTISNKKIEFTNKINKIINNIILNKINIWSKWEQYRMLIVETLWLLKDYLKMDYAGIAIPWDKIELLYENWSNKSLTEWELPIQISEASKHCDWNDNLFYLCPSESQNWWVDAIFVFKDLLWNITWFLLLDDEDEIRELKMLEIIQITEIFYDKIKWIFSEIVWYHGKIDFLTWLFNRRWWSEEVTKYMNMLKRENWNYSILALDIDYFKKVNDTYWHDVGDLVLKQLAKTIKGIVKRPIDVLVRMWWEEFVVFLPNTDQNGAFGLAQRIMEDFSSIPFNTQKWSFNTTVSIWLYSTQSDHTKTKDQIEQALKQADKALYTSKNNWRNQITIANQ